MSFLALTVAAYSGCNSSDSSDSPDLEGSGGGANIAGETSGESAAGTDGGGADGGGELTGDAGQTSVGGSRLVESSGGAGGAAGTIDDPELPDGPCTYRTTGGATLPPAAAHFICTAGSRVSQDNGGAEYSALFGAGFYLDGSNDSSTLACSVSSTTAPATGESWAIGADHPGNCELSSQQGATTNLWKASYRPAMGAATISFEDVTLTHGTADPNDVYYACTIKLSGTLAGETGAPDVDISGSFQIKLPLGG